MSLIFMLTVRYFKVFNFFCFRHPVLYEWEWTNWWPLFWWSIQLICRTLSWCTTAIWRPDFGTRWDCSFIYTVIISSFLKFFSLQWIIKHLIYFFIILKKDTTTSALFFNGVIFVVVYSFIFCFIQNTPILESKKHSYGNQSSWGPNLRKFYSTLWCISMLSSSSCGLWQLIWGSTLVT